MQCSSLAVVTSREEKKRQRREERLEQERQAAAEARRQQLLRSGGGIVLALAAVAAIVIAIAASGGGSKGSVGVGDGAGKPVALAPLKQANLQVAARDAGCVLRNFPNFGQDHTTEKVTYKTNPPTSGPHNPEWAQDGAYPPGNAPPVGQAVHALEHGRVELQWAQRTLPRTIGQLQSIFNEQGGYHALLFQNQTRMPYTVAATAWQHLIGCKRLTPATVDALRDFRKAYTDKAPEQVP